MDMDLLYMFALVTLAILLWNMWNYINYSWIKSYRNTPGYDYSIEDGSISRLSSSRNGTTYDPYLKNPSTLIKDGTMLKTSSQWYLARPDQDMTIICPTGWTDLENPTQFWYSQLISFEEYMERLSKSTLGPSKFPEQPF